MLFRASSFFLFAPACLLFFWYILELLAGYIFEDEFACKARHRQPRVTRALNSRPPVDLPSTQVYQQKKRQSRARSETEAAPGEAYIPSKSRVVLDFYSHHGRAGIRIGAAGRSAAAGAAGAPYDSAHFFYGQSRCHFLIFLVFSTQRDTHPSVPLCMM